MTAVDGAGRLWLLYRQPNLHLFVPALWIGAALVAGLIALRFAAPALVAIGLTLIIAAPVRLRSGAEGLLATFDPLPPGYRPVLQTRYGTVSERTSSRPWDANQVNAWYLPPGKIAAANLPVDGGAASESAHRLQPGEQVFVPPLTVLRLEKDETQSLQPAEGSAMRLLNCGGLVNGRPQGLLYRHHAGAWRTDRTPLPLPESSVISIERGSFQIERLADDRGPYLRIRAQNDAQWLVLVTALPPLHDAEPLPHLRPRAPPRAPRPPSGYGRAMKSPTIRLHPANGKSYASGGAHAIRRLTITWRSATSTCVRAILSRCASKALFPASSLRWPLGGRRLVPGRSARPPPDGCRWTGGDGWPSSRQTLPV